MQQNAAVSAPIEPSPMSRGAAIGWAVGGPLLMGAVMFLPAGSMGWVAGWAFLLAALAAGMVSVVVLRRVNPVIFRARSRIQPGTKLWDKALLALLMPAVLAILVVAALDAGRFHWRPLPGWAILAGYLVFLAGFALVAWAQAVNRFFEPGVRIQSERHHHVVDGGPYAVVRHPGYAGAILLFAGAALALGSLWALVPAAAATGVLVLRTVWEDRLLRAELAGYQDFARRTRWRLVPGLW